jgi:hypothetical protein
VFFYDRLGTGKSSKYVQFNPSPHPQLSRLTSTPIRVSGFDSSPVTIQLTILQQLTILLRPGKRTVTLGTPSKIVHIGHSFGSFISNALIATTAMLSDAALLTGIGYSGGTFNAFIEAFGLQVATAQAPGKWTGRDNGYLTWVDAFANAATFFQGNS